MENHNKNLNHSLAVLSHPLTILVFLLYLVNTFLFQRIAPSWWTGKLGDFAWLFFFPFVLCVPLSLLTARKDSNRQVIYLAIALCGIPFALLKGSSQLLDVVSGTVKAWSGMTLDLAGDPSDLIALTSLVVSAWFWNSRRPTRVVPNKFAYILMVSSVMFTLADSAGPDEGIQKLLLQDGRLFACSSYMVYQSEDGGMEWGQMQDLPQDVCGNKDDSIPVVDPSNTKIQYKYVEYGEIHRSEDAGSTWSLDYSWKPVSDAALIYVKMTQRTEYYSYYPLNAIYEPRSGNTVLAMGTQGVLIRQQNGQYVWREVGSFENTYVEPEPLLVLQTLIWEEVYLGVLLGCLLSSLLALKIAPSQLRGIIVYLSLLAWLVEAIILQPGSLSSSIYSEPFYVLGCKVLPSLALPLFVWSLVMAGAYQNRFFFRMLFLCGLIILTFPLPYALWALGVYNGPYFALLSAILLEAAIAILFIRKLRQEFAVAPETEGPSRPTS